MFASLALPKCVLENGSACHYTRWELSLAVWADGGPAEVEWGETR